MFALKECTVTVCLPSVTVMPSELIVTLSSSPASALVRNGKSSISMSGRLVIHPEQTAASAAWSSATPTAIRSAPTSRPPTTPRPINSLTEPCIALPLRRSNRSPFGGERTPGYGHRDDRTHAPVPERQSGNRRSASGERRQHLHRPARGQRHPGGLPAAGLLAVQQERAHRQQPQQFRPVG